MLKEILEMPPKKDSKEPMEQVTTQIPAPMLSDIDQLAESWGMSRAELLRHAISEGLPSLFRRDIERLERENRMLVNAKLKRRTAPIYEAIDVLDRTGQSPEVLALLKESISA